MNYAVDVLERERNRISGIIKTHKEAVERGEYLGYTLDIPGYQKQCDELDEAIGELKAAKTSIK